MTKVYVSKWQKRKQQRYINRRDLENGTVTNATIMMKARGITGRPFGWKVKKNMSDSSHEDQSLKP